LAEGVLLQLETAGATVEFLQGIDGIDDVIAGAVELFFRVLEVLANLPHQQLYYRLALLAHATQKGFNMLNAFGDTHGRPQALTTVISTNGGVQSGQRGVGIQQRRAAEDHLLVAVRTAQVHRAADLGERPGPGFQLAIDQVLTLLGLAFEAVLFRDVSVAREQVVENIGCGHVATPSGLGDALVKRFSRPGPRLS